MPEDRLYFEDHHGRATSIPKHFTDLGPIDPVIIMGRGRSLFRIRDLLDQPQKYEGKTVRVAGTVTKSAGVLGTGAFEIDDGTGKIYVIVKGSGVPREGAKTKAEGQFESLFSFLGRTMAAIVQKP